MFHEPAVARGSQFDTHILRLCLTAWSKIQISFWLKWE